MSHTKTNPRLPSKSEDKAERTTRTANGILDAERQASAAKVARLKALRLAEQPETAPEKPRRAAGASTGKVRAASLRKLALQGDIAPGKRK